MHRFRAVLLGKDIRAECLRRLLQPQLVQQPDNRRVNVNRAGFAAFGRVEVDAFLWGVAEVPADGNGVRGKVNVLPS